MKKYMILPLIIVFSACSTVGSVRKTEQENIFIISISSNAFSSSDKRKAVFEKKALKACNGGEYEVVKPGDSKIQNIRTYGSTPTSTMVASSETVIMCKGVSG